MPSGYLMTVRGRPRRPGRMNEATASKYRSRSPLVSPASGQNTLSRFDRSTPPGIAAVIRGKIACCLLGSASRECQTLPSQLRCANWEGTCPRCGLSKPVMEFEWWDAAHKKPQSWCRDCTRAAWIAWYSDERNRKKHLAQLHTRRRRRIRRNQRVISELKSQPC